MIWTDDVDVNENSFNILFGGNGDYYMNMRYLITFGPQKGLYFSDAVRMRTSGSSLPPSVLVAVANLYREMEKHGINGNEQVHPATK